MSLLFKCPLCNRRHLGVCPWIDFLKIYANGVARIVEAQGTCVEQCYKAAAETLGKNCHCRVEAEYADRAALTKGASNG